PPPSPLFPYTTLFRSSRGGRMRVPPTTGTEPFTPSGERRWRHPAGSMATIVVHNFLIPANRSASTQRTIGMKPNGAWRPDDDGRSEEHTSELQSLAYL